VVQRLAHGLAERGHQVRVASLMSGGGVAKELESSGIPVVSLEADRVGGGRAALSLLTHLRADHVDVLHAFLFHSNLLGRMIGCVARVPAVIASERSVESSKAAWRVWADRLTWRLADRWTANAQEVSRVLQRREKVDPDRIEVIPNGIDLAYFAAPVSASAFRSRYRLDVQDRVVLCAGRLDPMKGQHTLLEAFHVVLQDEPDARLCLVGDGPLRPALERRAGELKLGDRVVFAGTLADVRCAFAAAELLVLPSVEEGLPGIVMEAQAAGVPVVATAVGGTPELIQHDRTGLLVPPRDSVALAAAILRLLRSRELCQRLSAAAGAGIQNLSTERMVDATVVMYQALLSRQSAPAGAEAA
jgi:glycosyltransferase involved in cell wall biosynthesis